MQESKQDDPEWMVSFTQVRGWWVRFRISRATHKVS